MNPNLIRAASCLAIVGVLAGCTSVTTDPSAAPSNSPISAAPSTVPSAPSAEPSASPDASFLVLPTKPPKTPKPPKSAEPTQPAGPGAANLIITKFVTDDDRFVVGVHSQVRITIKNEGSADAGLFDLGISFTDGIGGGGMTPTAVDGLAAGESVQVDIAVTPLAPGNFTYTATADASDVVSESNEDDNTKDLPIAVVDLPNMGFFGDPFRIAQLPGETGYRMQYNYANLGDVTVETIFTISFDWSSINASGNFPSTDCCATSDGMHWGPGAESLSNNGPFSFPTAGDYTVTVTLDATHVVEESDETDNQQTAHVSVP